MELKNLQPGSRFQLLDGRTGTLLMVNVCRARVRLDNSEQRVSFTTYRGEEVEFSKTRDRDMSPGTEIETT